MGFVRPEWLCSLALLPVLGLLVMQWHAQDVRRRARFGDALLVARLAPGGAAHGAVRALLVGVGLVLFCIGAARPHAGRGWYDAVGYGTDVCFAIDVSNSMRAEDADRRRARIDAAKWIAADVLDRLEFDRVALVTFSDQAATICPLTSDMSAAVTTLSGVECELVGEGGTSLAQALIESCRRFDLEESRGRLVVILSDGEDHEDGIDDAIDEAKEKGIPVHTVGIGSRDGARVPSGGLFMRGYKTYRGRPVVSSLQEGSLKRIAKETGGTYLGADRSDVARRLADDIRRRAGKGRVVRVVAGKRELFQVFIALGVLVLVAEMLWPLRAGSRRRRP
jgi:Ca-activated chloride channel family protein